MQPIRLLLVDDHDLFRESLARLLASEADLAVAGSAATAREALELLDQRPVDVVLLDYDLGEDHAGNLIAAARAKGFEGRFLMVTAGMDARESSRLLNLGVSGIFHKQNPPGTLNTAIRQVASGEMWVDPKVIRLLADEFPKREDTVRPHLTEREKAVLQGLFEGATNKELAAQLRVSESAVKATLQQLFQKTGVRTRSQLVRIALEGSLVARR